MIRHTQQIDPSGVVVSCANIDALETYQRALNQFHDYFGDPVETIDKALEQEPDFLLGHLFRGAMFAVLMEQKFRAEIQRSVDAVEARFHRANHRERGHLAALKQFLAGDFKGAADAWDRVLHDHPRDALALQCGHLMDFYLGDAVNLRDRVARVLPHYDASHPSRSFVLGMQSFGFEECNQFERAEEIGRQALDLEPRDPWAIHAVAHVMEMGNRYDEGIVWYHQRREHWAGDNGLAFHNWWHLALFHVERGQYEAALAIYDQYIHPEKAEFILALVDATAFLWRLQLHGIDVGNRWLALAGEWNAHAVRENGFYAFNDCHAMMAFVGAGLQNAQDDLVQDMQRVARGAQGDAAVIAAVGLPVAGAIRAFGRERYTECVDALLPVRSTANRFGGSNAQRDVLNQTLIMAAIRARRLGLARQLVNERLAHRPDSPLAWWFKTLVVKTMQEGEAGLTAAARRASPTTDRHAA